MDTTPPVERAPAYPVDLVVTYPERSSRLYALLAILFLVKVLLLIPHLIILYFLGIFQFIVAVIAWIAVLFTGRYPRGLFEFVAGVLRWQVRAEAWILGLVDRYPPFSLN